MFEIVCSGPGPHIPSDGILGFSTIDGPHWVRCGSVACKIVDVQQPLPPVGALATLLAVESVLTVTDAANAVGLTPDDLTNEALAWGAAAAAANQP